MKTDKENITNENQEAPKMDVAKMKMSDPLYKQPEDPLKIGLSPNELPILGVHSVFNNILASQSTEKQEAVTKRKVKRKRQPELWKRNILKKKREAGEEYVNAKGICKPAKIVKPGCDDNCKLLCSTNFSAVLREKIKSEFYSLTDEEKYVFYAKYTMRKGVGRKRTKKEQSRRSNTFHYFLPQDKNIVRVCKKFFCNTLDISISRIHYFHKKLSETNVILPTPNKGNSIKQSSIKTCKKTQKEKEEEVICHIKSFPLEELCKISGSQDNTTGLSVAKMYSLYADQHDNPVTENVYRKLYNQIISNELPILGDHSVFSSIVSPSIVTQDGEFINSLASSEKEAFNSMLGTPSVEKQNDGLHSVSASPNVRNQGAYDSVSAPSIENQDGVSNSTVGGPSFENQGGFNRISACNSVENQKGALTSSASVFEKLDGAVSDEKTKRKRQPELRKRNVLKKNKEAGEECINEKGIRKAAKSVSPGCEDNCKLLCSANFSTELREKLKSEFNSLSDEEKYVFYTKYTIRKDIENKKTEEEKSNTLQYFLPQDNKNVRVCKIFFCNTLDISTNQIQYFDMKLSESDFKLPTPRKGKHVKKKTPQEKEEEVISHIKSFPLEELPKISGSRQCKTSLSIAKMYSLYAQQHENPVKENVYRKICNQVCSNELPTLGVHSVFNNMFPCSNIETSTIRNHYGAYNSNFTPSIENQNGPESVTAYPNIVKQDGGFNSAAFSSNEIQYGAYNCISAYASNEKRHGEEFNRDRVFSSTFSSPGNQDGGFNNFLPASIENQSRAFNSSSASTSIESQDGAVSKGKVKRKRQPELWKRNVLKKKREAGETYINEKGICKPAKTVKPGCDDNCKLSCSANFSAVLREKIKSEFYSLTDEEKYMFYAKYTMRKEVARKRTKKEQSRRTYTMQYFLPQDNKSVRVCKIFFCSTLDISISRIHYFHTKLSESDLIPTPRKGKFVKKKTPQEKEEEVISHIKSFPLEELPKISGSRQCKSSLSIAKMYTLYAQQHENPVKENVYRKFCNQRMKTKIDIESLRTEHESDEQWEVRRNFMIEHQDSFEEAELITLAQLFTNIEFLGCRYPAETMKRIAKLSEKVAEKYRESRRNKLKRTFVGAQDAAEMKAKRTFTK